MTGAVLVPAAAADGTRLACWDFGTGLPPGAPPVLLVHGAGLNGLSWAPLADRCASRGLRCVALDMRAHGASGAPGVGGLAWENFGEDVVAVVDQLGLRGALGAGHSAGASALLLAEQARPGTLGAIWAWEPIMAVPGDNLRHVRGPELAARARRRRRHFSSIEEARDHFAGRGLFSDFSAEALEGYLQGGLRPAAGAGLTLSCRPQDEAAIYEGGGAHDAWAALAGLRCPLRLVGGGASPAVPPPELARIRAEVPGSEVQVYPGLGHFGPFQQPTVAADDIVRWHHRLQAAGGPTTRSHTGDGPPPVSGPLGSL
jgi:pimeloyl-ACP methyl ester carboxylesterase